MSLAAISWEERHPIIIPKSNHITTLLVQHYHELVAHQGRHITEGAIRSAKLWILGGKRLVTSIIHNCVTCRRLRGVVEQQKMSDLPADCLTQSPPIHKSWAGCIWIIERLRSTYQGRPLRKQALGRHVYLFGHKGSPYGDSQVSIYIDLDKCA